MERCSNENVKWNISPALVTKFRYKGHTFRVNLDKQM